MLSTEFLLLAVGFAVGAAITGAYLAYRAHKHAQSAIDFAQQALDWVQDNNKRSISLAKLADHETALTELTDSFDALLRSHKKLRSRIGMREHRERKKTNGAASGEESYEETKKRLRDTAKSKGYL